MVKTVTFLDLKSILYLVICGCLSLLDFTTKFLGCFSLSLYQGIVEIITLDEFSSNEDSRYFGTIFPVLAFIMSWRNIDLYE